MTRQFKIQVGIGTIEYGLAPMKEMGYSVSKCFGRFKHLEYLCSVVDYIAKVYLVEKEDNAPSGSGTILYTKMFEQIAKAYKNKSVLLVSSSCDNLWDNTNYPAFRSAYAAAEDSKIVTHYEFKLEDYFMCSECGESYTDEDQSNEQCCEDGFLDYSDSQGYYYILIGSAVSKGSMLLF